ncbi:amidohydrolase [Sandarakinorhabdus sp.]|uniref:amidohydrolase n=1 Tax=Sandarakinorhabdus sp. TaxID=1916663 RepID=UPI003F6E6DAA
MTNYKMLAALLAATMMAGPALALSTPAQKKAIADGVEARAKLAQEMVDMVFSYAEPGFQEHKTSEYLAAILEKNGFKVERGAAGIPTAFNATWSNGPGPKIALGSDIDGLLGLSQYPGTVEMKPMVEGGPGHGEGHNSGMPMVIIAALAAKDVMEKNGIKGTLMLWPGVAEELLATKAYYVRAGMFKDVDASIFAHVGRDFGTAWGPAGNNGMVSVEYTFKGKTAHAAGQPWDGRSALDGVELMNIGWNMRREHLPVTQRSHYVITEGGGQPNIVPEKASVWYYFREGNFAKIRGLYEIGNRIAEAAAMATDTTVTKRTLGYAAPNFGNKPLAEALYANIKAVGLPQWSAADQGFAKAMQQANGVKVEPLATTLQPLSTPDLRGPSMGGGSDDIGDIMWTVPTVTVRYPSNIPNAIGHNRQSAIAMATPIAHKGVVVAAKAVGMTVIDLLTTPKIIADAKAYQQDVQFKTDTYDPLLTPQDTPAIHLNADIMSKMRPQLEKFYYDPAKYKTYLEQLGINYEDFAKVK